MCSEEVQVCVGGARRRNGGKETQAEKEEEWSSQRHSQKPETIPNGQRTSWAEVSPTQLQGKLRELISGFNGLM
jgi:hypothetical protein